MSFALPNDVTRWLRHIFHGCNSRVSTKLSNIPTAHETNLDLTFIESLSHFKSFKAQSNWTVRIETHYLGGGRHFGEWEVADIGIIATLRQAGQFRLAKVAVLQSKRLYPIEQNYEEDKPIDYHVGFGRLIEPNDPQFTTQTRHFTFSEDSKYKAIVSGDNQWNAIQNYEKHNGVPVYYLLYNPRRIPWTALIPIAVKQPPKGPLKVGCRVLTSGKMAESIKGKLSGYSPSYSELSSLDAPFNSIRNRAGWPLEHFVVDLIMGCKAGFRARTEKDPELETVFYRRTGPIAAAIGITVDAPKDASLSLEEA